MSSLGALLDAVVEAVEGLLLDTLELWAGLDNFVLRTRLDIGTVLLFGPLDLVVEAVRLPRFVDVLQILRPDLEWALPRFVNMLLLLLSILHIRCRRSCSQSILLCVPSCCQGCFHSMILALLIGFRLMVFRP